MLHAVRLGCPILPDLVVPTKIDISGLFEVECRLDSLRSPESQLSLPDKGFSSDMVHVSEVLPPKPYGARK